MTKKQKEDRQRALQMLEQMKAQGKVTFLI